MGVGKGSRRLNFDLVTTIDETRAKQDFQDAKRFIMDVEEWLKQEHGL